MKRKYKNIQKLTLLFSVVLLISCNKDNDEPLDDCINPEFFSEYSTRNFEMGFSTWAYAKTVESVDKTYQFINENFLITFGV